jgi:hypothetical protein
MIDMGEVLVAVDPVAVWESQDVESDIDGKTFNGNGFMSERWRSACCGSRTRLDIGWMDTTGSGAQNCHSETTSSNATGPGVGPVLQSSAPPPSCTTEDVDELEADAEEEEEVVEWGKVIVDGNHGDHPGELRFNASPRRGPPSSCCCAGNVTQNVVPPCGAAWRAKPMRPPSISVNR